MRCTMCEPRPRRSQHAFSLQFYRSQLDGADDLQGGLLRHFLETGLLRGFKPTPTFDPIAYYRWADDKTFDIRSSLRRFATRKDTSQQEIGEPPTEGQAKALFRAKADALQLHYGRLPSASIPRGRRTSASSWCCTTTFR